MCIKTSFCHFEGALALGFLEMTPPVTRCHRVISKHMTRMTCNDKNVIYVNFTLSRG